MSAINTFSPLSKSAKSLLYDSPPHRRLRKYFGKPKYYEIVSNGNIVKIHPSRFVLFYGEQRLDEWAYSGASRGWGDSVLQAAYNWMRNADSTGHNIASLIFEANINVFKIPDLFDKLADPEQESKIQKRLNSPPHRRLRNCICIATNGIYNSPPHRRLRNVCTTNTLLRFYSPPHRRLRNGAQSNRDNC